MNIKGIKKLRSGKYQIVFDNKETIITYDEVILKNNILYKKELSTSDLNEITKLNDYYNVYYSVVKYISKKMRSEKEIREYIKKYELNEKETIRMINTLKDNGMLNDNRYIKAYISDRFYLSNDGPYKIKKDLLGHNITEEKIDEEIEKIAHDEIIKKISKILDKKIRNSKGSSYNVKQKIYNDLYNLGYTKNMIDECFIESIDDSKSLEKDFDKIYKEVSRKEEDIQKIIYRTKQKLYQKGYSIDRINNLIEKKDTRI